MKLEKLTFKNGYVLGLKVKTAKTTNNIKRLSFKGLNIDFISNFTIL